MASYPRPVQEPSWHSKLGQVKIMTMYNSLHRTDAETRGFVPVRPERTVRGRQCRWASDDYPLSFPPSPKPHLAGGIILPATEASRVLFPLEVLPSCLPPSPPTPHLARGRTSAFYNDREPDFAPRPGVSSPCLPPPPTPHLARGRGSIFISCAS